MKQKYCLKNKTKILVDNIFNDFLSNSSFDPVNKTI